jgi:hypothetical protein
MALIATLRANNVSHTHMVDGLIAWLIIVPNSEQSYKGKVKTHNYINRQNQSIVLFFENYVA